MKLLAIDTSTDCCSVALRVDGEVRDARRAGAREQTLHLLPMVEALLAGAGVSLRGLDAIACTQGPGAFTGVRVGVSVAQGLAYGAGVPAIGISTLAALAQQAVRRHPGATCLLPLLDARMGELYAGAYRRGDDGLVDPLLPDRLLQPGAVAGGLPALAPDDGGWFAIGSGATLAEWPAGFPVAVSDSALEPDALDVLALAVRALARGDARDPAQLLPVYLRDQVAWKKIGEQGRA